MVWVVIVVLLLVLVLTAVFSPWRWPDVGRAGRSDDELRHAGTEVLDLQAARDQKYQEIRDVELDRETGKLSIEDFTTTDTTLRAEAVEILQQLDRAQKRFERLQRADEAESSVDTSWTRTEAAESRAGVGEQPDPVQTDRD